MENRGPEVFKYRNKRLTVRSESVRYEFGPTYYVVEKPIAIMYWAEPIELDMFRIGSKVKLKLMGEDGSNLTFVLRAYFGVGWNQILKVFEEILERLWEYYFGDIEQYFGESIEAGNSVVIEDFQISNESISLLGNNSKVIRKILFKDASLKETYDQLIVSSKSNPELYIAIKNRWDWNAPIIQTIIKRLCPLST